MAVTMTLDGFDLGTNFPLYAQSITNSFIDEQGAGHKRITITLSGFLEAANSAAVMALINTLKSNIDTKNRAAFTYTDGATTIHNNRDVWVSSIGFPEDSEGAHNAYADYSIVLYYFEDTVDSSGLTCSYNGYTFDKFPQWGRSIKPNRESHRGDLYGSTATINLSTEIFAANHAALMSEIDSLQTAFSDDATLTYGSFVQACRVGNVDIEQGTKIHTALVNIELMYDIGTTVSLSVKKVFSRLHNNINIVEQPFCNNINVVPVSESGQTVDYTFKVSAEDISTCRSILATEIQNHIIPGGYEKPGGQESQDPDTMSVTLTIKKYYPFPVLANLDLA